MKNFAIAMMLTALVILLVPRVSRAQTQLQMDEESCGAFKKSDAQLNQVYQQILAKLAHDRVATQHVKAAERAWIAFRDAEMEAVYPPREAGYYGTVQPMCECDERAALTDERVKQLQRWLTTKEGDVCAGTRWP
ncbi:MAG: lysozyme inhibitor LprI family protein [Candidatus Binataceae bacterium]